MVRKEPREGVALIEKRVDSEEEVLHYATGWRYSPDIFTWLPNIETIIDTTKKRYLLAASRDKF